MTTQDAMLKLAREAMPEHKWHASADGAVMTKVPDVDDLVYFDPASDDSQAVAVELWLLDRDANNSISKGCILYVATDATGWAKRAEYFHDPTSFRAAVTKAALRVVA